MLILAICMALASPLRTEEVAIVVDGTFGKADSVFVGRVLPRDAYEGCDPLVRPVRAIWRDVPKSDLVVKSCPGQRVNALRYQRGQEDVFYLLRGQAFGFRGLYVDAPEISGADRIRFFERIAWLYEPGLVIRERSQRLAGLLASEDEVLRETAAFLAVRGRRGMYGEAYTPELLIRPLGAAFPRLNLALQRVVQSYFYGLIGPNAPELPPDLRAVALQYANVELEPPRLSE